MYRHYRIPIVVVCAICMISTGLFGQSLDELLASKVTLEEIMTTVDAYYQDLQSQGIDRMPGEPRYKHWKRYEWYMSSRLGPNGEFVDIPSRMLSAKLRLDKREQDQSAGRSTISQWNFVGPTSSSYAGNNASAEVFNGIGRVDRIAFHPSDTNFIIVGTPAGGLWKTTTGGASWTPIDDYLPSLGVSGIVISHENPNTIYIATGDGDGNITGGLIGNMGYLRRSAGVLKSTNGGNTWQNTGTLSTLAYVMYDLVQSPSDPLLLLAATSRGLYRTTNGGTSWTKERSGVHHDIEFKPGSGQTVYVTSWSNVLYSTNAGDSWTSANVDSSTCCGKRLAIATTPADTNVVYLLAGPNSTAGSFDGVFKSTDSGQSYAQVTNTPNLLDKTASGSGDFEQNEYVQNIAVSPSDANLVVTGCTIGFGSIDGGNMWSNITTYQEAADTAQYVHPDIHDVKFNPISGTLYFATDGGLNRSYDNGSTWANIGIGIYTTQFYNMIGDPTDSDILVGGCQDNGIKFRQSNSGNFVHFDCCDGFDFSLSTVDGKYYSSINQGINRYENYGVIKTFISPGDAWFRPVAAHKSLANTVYVGHAPVWRSDNSGDSWINLGATGSWCIEPCQDNVSRIYAAGSPGGSAGTSSNGEFWRSEFLGANWVRLDENPGFPTSFTKITDIATKSTNSKEVVVTMAGFAAGQKVYRSIDTGATWTNISGTLPNVPVNCAAVTTTGDIYVGTDLGVFYKSNLMSDWIPYSNDLPRVPVTSLIVNESSNLIRAATFGRATWEASISDGICEDSLAWVVNTTLDGTSFFQAANWITHTANLTINGGISTDIFFKAGDYIDLKPGFVAKNDGAQFKAYIGTCVDGGVPVDGGQNTSKADK